MADRYWVGGTANWDATAGTKWSNTSGGAGGFSVPTEFDNVFFDAASGTVTCTVTGGSFSSTAICANLNCTGFTGSITATTNSTLSCAGNLILGASMSNFGFSGANFKFIGTGSYTITSNGILSRWAGNDGGLYLIGSCTVTLLDNFSAQRVTLGGNFATNIVFNLNNFNLILPNVLFPSARINLYGQSSAGPTLNFGTTGKIIVRQPGTGSTAPITIDRSSFGSQLFITGSKNVEVDCTTGGILEQNYVVPEELAFNWTSTASNTALFRFLYVGDVDWSLGTGGIQTRSTDTVCYGNWNSGSKDVQKFLSGYSDLAFNATSGTKTITGTGTWFAYLSIVPKGPVTYELGSNITTNNGNIHGVVWFASGTGAGATFNTNNRKITTSYFGASGGTCNLGTSIIESWANNIFFPATALVNLGSGVNASTATIRAIMFSGRIYTASNMTIGFLELATTNAISIAPTNVNLTINNIFNSIRPAAITFPAGVTTTINSFNLNGTAGNLVTVRSTTSGSLATLSKSSGTVNVSYLDIKDSNATGGATWNSPSENGNVDSGNNQGWDFFNGNLFYFFTRKT